ILRRSQALACRSASTARQIFRQGASRYMTCRWSTFFGSRGRGSQKAASANSCGFFSNSRPTAVKKSSTTSAGDGIELRLEDCRHTFDQLDPRLLDVMSSNPLWTPRRNRGMGAGQLPRPSNLLQIRDERRDFLVEDQPTSGC